MSDVFETDLTGAASPPRDNGEIVFAAPWQRRAFGLTIALCRAGSCEWDGFRTRLIARIAEDRERDYWRSWALALEDVLPTELDPPELDARTREFLARPAGHDHHHH